MVRSALPVLQCLGLTALLRGAHIIAGTKGMPRRRAQASRSLAHGLQSQIHQLLYLHLSWSPTKRHATYTPRAARTQRWPRTQVIEANLDAVNGVIAALNAQLATGMAWSDIERLIDDERRKGAPLAALIASLNLSEGRATLLLDDWLALDDSDDDDDDDGDDAASADESHAGGGGGASAARARAARARHRGPHRQRLHQREVRCLPCCLRTRNRNLSLPRMQLLLQDPTCEQSVASCQGHVLFPLFAQFVACH